jgi:hypothetical protein
VHILAKNTHTTCVLQEPAEFLESHIMGQYKTKFATALLTLALPLLGGGGATSHFKVTAFHVLPASGVGKTIALVPVDKGNESSLEFHTHSSRIA